MSTTGSVPSATVSVVVPTKNTARTLEACLSSIRAQTYPCQSVVVDNASCDATLEIATELADMVLHAGPERSAQRNHGARSCPADIVGFIDADMVLEPTVVEQAVEAISAGAGSVIIPERTVGSGFWVAVRAFERSFYDGSDAIEAARFFRWDIFDRVGGFDESLTGPEDWDLSEAARQLGSVERITAAIEHDEGTIGYLNACRKKAYYAEGMRRYVAKRGIGALRQATQRPWLRQPHRLANRRGIGLIALKVGELVAVTAALGKASVHRKLERTGGDRIVVDKRSSVPWTRNRATVLSPLTRQSTIQRTVYCIERIWCLVILIIKSHRTMQSTGQVRVHTALRHFIPGQTRDITLVGRDGIRILVPAQVKTWWTVAEVVIGDCYRLDRIPPQLQPTTFHVIDIGAHVGSFTIAIAHKIPHAEIIAYEAACHWYSYLQRNVKANGLEDRVNTMQAAIARGHLEKEFTDQNYGEASIAADEQLIHVVTIDEAIRAVDSHIDVMKMDCRGGEYDIIASASDVMMRRINRLVLKYYPAPPADTARLFSRIAAVGLIEEWRHDILSEQLGIVSFRRDDR